MKPDFLNMSRAEIDALPSGQQHALIVKLVQQDAVKVLEWAAAQGWKIERFALVCAYIAYGCVDVDNPSVPAEDKEHLRLWLEGFREASQKSRVT